MYNGIVNVYKEKGYTSHDVVAKLRGILKQKKIGHTGTLDPDAEGVLPVCLGKGTKLCDFLTEKDKTYKAVMLLGTTTDTQDTSGQIINKKEVLADSASIREAVLSFKGEYNQIPPMYSALKVNGKKLYELAREGKTIDRKSRKVMIHDITIEEIDEEKKEVTMLVSCSKGTYIRTLCNDIGEKLNCGACMKNLIRTKSGRFNLEESKTLSEIEEAVRTNVIDNYVIDIDKMFEEYKEIVIKEEFSKIVYNGNMFCNKEIKEIKEIENEERVRVYTENKEFVAIYKYDSTKECFVIVKMFYVG